MNRVCLACGCERPIEQFYMRKPAQGYRDRTCSKCRDGQQKIKRSATATPASVESAFSAWRHPPTPGTLMGRIA